MTTHSAPIPTRSPLAPLAAFLLLAITTLAFQGVVKHPFSWWDDQETIHQNPMFNPPTGEKIRQAWTGTQNGLYVPLTYTFWGALAHAAEMPNADAMGIHLDARVYHTASLVLHLASALLVFSILHLLTGRIWPSLAGALLFSLHPVQVETVAWASGAKDLLCGLLGLCAVYQYILHTKATGRRAAFYLTSSCLMVVLAMLAKPSAMIVPLITLAIDRLILHRPWRNVLKASGMLLLATIPLAIIARIVQVTPQAVHVAWYQRPLIAGDVLTFYLYKLFLPIQMGPEYGRRPQVVLEMWNGAWAYVAWMIPAAIALLAWHWRKQRPWFTAACIIFIAGVLPVLGFTPFMFQYMSSVADHYLYLSMLAPAMLLTWLLTRLPSPQWKPAGLATTAALAVLAFRSADQMKIWRDEETLWSHDLAIAKDSFVAPMNLAAHYGRQSRVLADQIAQAQQSGDIEQARQLTARRTATLQRTVALLEQTIALRPTYTTARHNAYINYLRLNQPEKALEHLEALIALNKNAPADVQATLLPHHNAAGEICLKLRQYDRAVEHFQHIANLMPTDPTAKERLAIARSRQAEARLDPSR